MEIEKEVRDRLTSLLREAATDQRGHCLTVSGTSHTTIVAPNSTIVLCQSTGADSKKVGRSA